MDGQCTQKLSILFVSNNVTLTINNSKDNDNNTLVKNKVNCSQGRMFMVSKSKLIVALLKW